jgi:hypothetical protein
MDTFHTYADWKAQNMQDNIEKLHQRRTDYNQLRAQCEELKGQLNRRASERAQREMRKKEVGECIQFLFKLEWTSECVLVYVLLIHLICYNLFPITSFSLMSVNFVVIVTYSALIRI